MQLDSHGKCCCRSSLQRKPVGEPVFPNSMVAVLPNTCIHPTVDGSYCAEVIVPQYPRSSTDHRSITTDSIIGNHSKDIAI